MAVPLNSRGFPNFLHLNSPYIRPFPAAPSANDQVSQSQSDMAQQSEAAALTSALGTLIGYIGSEAAIEDSFGSLLWPQRFFNSVSWRDLLPLGLLAPMGGPLHKAALTTLDKFHHNGLFKKANQGNMLGTAFFHDTQLKYHERDTVSGEKKGKEFVRNGLWVQVIAKIPIHSGMDEAKQKKQHLEEVGEAKQPLLIRAKSCVNFLTLSHMPPKEKIDPSLMVRNDTGPARYQTFFMLVWSEVTSLITGTVVLVYWRSAFSILWFLPIVLRLLSAAFAIERENLLPPPTNTGGPKHPTSTKSFEVNTRGHGFLIVEGEESTVLQFFRHYGHPRRNRFREVVQIILTITLGLVFPAGLVSSIIWMPVGMQYFWLSYQLYATIALYISRYTKTHQRTQTDARLAQKLEKGLAKNEDGIAYLQDEKGTTVKAQLTRVPIRSYGEGQKIVEQYFTARPQKRKQTWMSEEKTLSDVVAVDEIVTTPSESS